jgi:HK97 gp10 family phage protein
MPDGVTVTFDIPDFRKQLQALGDKVEKRIGRKAVAGGAKVFREIAKQNAPVLTKIVKRRSPGALKNNIIIKGRRGSPGIVTYSVLVRTAKRLKGSKSAKLRATGDPFYWYFLEHGFSPTGPHGQTGRHARQLVRSRRRASGRVYKFPFLAPAFQSGGSRALAEIIRIMTEEIAKENSRVV